MKPIDKEPERFRSTPLKQSTNTIRMLLKLGIAFNNNQFSSAPFVSPAGIALHIFEHMVSSPNYERSTHTSTTTFQKFPTNHIASSIGSTSDSTILSVRLCFKIRDLDASQEGEIRNTYYEHKPQQ